MQRIVVIGGGTMGIGIASLIAINNLNVTILERSKKKGEQCKKNVEKSIARKIRNNIITKDEGKDTTSKITITYDPHILRNADFVIESVDEKIDVKNAVFQLCDRYCRPGVVYATNTSTLSISEIASATEREDKVIGLHFVYPVSSDSLAEIVVGKNTSMQTVDVIKKFLSLVNLQGIEVFESPGFVTTRLIILLINEAANILMEGIAGARDIDLAMKKGYKFELGPLEMADRFGLDSVLAASERLFKEFGETKHRPAPIIKKMVREGRLGVKARKGFFKYNEDKERLD